jgi:F-type H+-transporting ATPase subunit b
MAEDNHTTAADEATNAASESTHTEEPSNPIEAVAGQFGLKGDIFIAQLINFVIVLLVLWRFAYKPIIRKLDERQDKIDKSVKTATEIEKRFAALEDEKAAILKEARGAAQDLLEKANSDGDARRNEIVDAAKREVERVITKGKTQLAAEKAEMLRALKKDIVDIAMKASVRVLQEEVDEKRSTSFAEEVVRKLT